MAFLRGALLVLCTAIFVVWLPSLFRTRRPIVVGGYVKPGWEKVEQVFRKRIESGEERGASFAVYHRGEPVVHLYGGYADEEAAVPWRKDTLSVFFSTTKGIGAIVMALLVERGYLDYDEPVVKYWPEFGQKGKDKVTVRQLLSHQAGLIAFEEKPSIHLLTDQPEKIAQIAAATSPLWKLGDGFGYHALTIGVYMDELVRRTDPDQRSISQFFDDEIRKPFGVDFFIGLPRSELYRTARYYDLSPAQMIKDLVLTPEMWSILGPFVFGSKDSLLMKAIKTFAEEDLLINDPMVREIPLASAFGHGTALGMAKLWGIVSNGGEIDGQKLMEPGTANTLNVPVISGIDKVINGNITCGVGTHIMVNPEGNLVAGHPGAGGQMGFMDPKRGLGWGYLTNYGSIKMVTDNYVAFTEAMYDAVKGVN